MIYVIINELKVIVAIISLFLLGLLVGIAWPFERKKKREKEEHLLKQKKLEEECLSLDYELEKLKLRKTPAYYMPNSYDYHQYYCYEVDRVRGFITSEEPRGLTIEDEEEALRLVIDIIRKTGCSFKEEDGKIILFKEKEEEKYDLYVYDHYVTE